MGLLQEFFNQVWVVRLMRSIITIVVSYFIYKIFAGILVSRIEGGKLKNIVNKKTKTYARLIKSIIRYTFILVTVFIILQIYGVNVSSMIAGVGIISIIIGFAIQDALKDIIKGFDIVSDSYYQVGDVIKYGDIIGRVLVVGLKTTKVEDVSTLNIVSISNRNIEQVEVVSDLINIDIPISYEVKINKAEKVIGEIVSNISDDKNVKSCEYRGVNNLDESAIKYQIKVYCDPLKKMQVRRDALGYILRGMEKNKLEVPYNQIDVHQK